ncbi:hypothetical protein JBE27_57575, partial [Streptomyces albiflaviniger]|nr:hypothetical protein [Streptomyces albiflaviniger]
MAAIVAGASLALGGTATAIAAQAEVPVLDRDGQLAQSINTDDTREKYGHLYDEAKRLDVEPDQNIAQGFVRGPVLDVQYAALSADVAKAKAKEKVEEETEPKFGTPESVGVSQSTLDALSLI